MRYEQHRGPYGRNDRIMYRWFCEEPDCDWATHWGLMIDVAPEAIRHVSWHAKAGDAMPAAG